MNEQQTLVSLRRVSKEYSRGKLKVKVLDNLDMDIAKASFLALMGPSGSGKSTLLNLIGGLDQPTQGDIIFEGKNISSMSSSALAHWRSHHVGFIFQFYNLLPVLTAERNVELPLLLTRLSRAERKRHVATALEVVALSDRAGHRPNELSGGEQQRVAIARALVSDASLLICDEPTGDLDRQTADEILGLLARLHQDHGKTIVMVTHDPLAAEFASDRLHLDKGTLSAEVAA